MPAPPRQRPRADYLRLQAPQDEGLRLCAPASYDARRRHSCIRSTRIHLCKRRRRHELRRRGKDVRGGRLARVRDAEVSAAAVGPRGRVAGWVREVHGRFRNGPRLARRRAEHAVLRRRARDVAALLFGASGVHGRRPRCFGMDRSKPQPRQNRSPRLVQLRLHRHKLARGAGWPSENSAAGRRRLRARDAAEHAHVLAKPR
mmetsp:Transcript_32758/g.110350  ORF Transcript_32758/g.110350 Transcript_32758/m.110350 type:complete len:202 (+) Transcript_32758:363-968(+)